MKKKYVAFDIGEVLYRVDLQPIYDVSNKLFGFNKEETERVLNQTQQDLGIENVVTLYQRRIPISASQKFIIENAWMNCITEVPEIIDLLTRLHQEYNIALLSNIGEYHSQYMHLQAPEPIRKCITHFSCEVGARKPTKLFFQSFLVEHPEFKGCLFVDDLWRNNDSAKAAGFNAQLFNLGHGKDHKESVARLEKIVLDNT